MQPKGLVVRCWGVRGSVPTPGPATARYGGNTACVEVLAPGGDRLVFDAGTGIRALGRALGAAGGSPRTDLFLTHFHWDHIQGLPFFEPLYDPAAELRVHGPREGELDLEDVIRNQMSPVYFPVPLERLAAKLVFRHLDGGDWHANGFRVSSLRVHHPAFTCGYLVRAAGASVAYLPDNELTATRRSPRSGRYTELCRFLEGVDLLIHDAMYTDAELPARRGWGHSSVGQAIRLAEDAGARTLCLFHHAPDRSDAELDEIVADRRRALVRSGASLRLFAAREREAIDVAPRSAATGPARTTSTG